MTLRGKRAALLALATALACTAETGPRPKAIAPDHGPSDVPVHVTISGDYFRPRVVTDFGHDGSSSMDARFTASLGSVFLRDVQLAPDGTLSATVPAGMPTGVHDLTVARPDGRAGSLGAAYRVLAAGELDAVVASYRIELTGKPPFQAFQPMEVTITALDARGGVATDFGGAVALEDATGTAVPARAGLFERGRWTGPVEIRMGAPIDALVAMDASGRSGTSPSFAVLPSAYARLTFSSKPVQLTAGACSGAIGIGLLDAFGGATAPAVPLAISIDAGPDAGLYSDEACSVPLDPTIPAYGNELTVRFRDPHAGVLTMRANAPGLEEALAEIPIDPAAPAKLAFVSRPQTLAAGDCASVTVEVQDAFDNAVQSPGLVVTLAADPPGSVAFYGDRTCTSSIASAGGVGSDATFYIRGEQAGTYRLTAGCGGLLPGSLTANVTAAPAADESTP